MQPEAKYWHRNHCADSGNLLITKLCVEKLEKAVLGAHGYSKG